MANIIYNENWAGLLHMLSTLEELQNVNVKKYYGSIANKAEYEQARSQRRRYLRKTTLLGRKFEQKQFQDTEPKLKGLNSKRNRKTKDEKEDKTKRLIPLTLEFINQINVHTKLRI